MDVKVQAAIAGIGNDAWTPIRYPRAVWDEQLGCRVSDAQVTETRYTAFTSKNSKRGQAITAGLACAASAHNLLRAVGALASLACARACGATLRRGLIHVAVRITRHGRGHIAIHLSEAGTASTSG